MSLEDYKKEAINYLRKESKSSTQTNLEKNLMMMPEEIWEEYIQDFSPKEFIQGRISGLI